MGNKNYRLIPMDKDVSIVYVGQTSPRLSKTIDHYIVELEEGKSFAISHHVDSDVNDGFVIGSLDLIPDHLVAKLAEEQA